MYKVQVEYRDYQHPEKSYTKVGPKTYRTERGAEKAARSYEFVCKPDGVTATEEISCRVLTAGM